MSTPSTYSQLNAELQQALQSLGVDSDEKLALYPPQQLLEDLRLYAQYFPERTLDISPLFGLLEQGEKTPAPPVKTSFTSKPKIQAIKPEQCLAAFKPRPKRHARDKKKRIPSAREKKTSSYGKKHAMRCRQSGRIYLGALITPFVLISSILFISSPIVALLFNLSPDYILAFFILTLLSLCIYYIFLRSITCQVCHIRLFSLQNYPRSKFAHRYPLIGYNIALALQIIFKRWFNCPACGTPQQLFKPKQEHSPQKTNTPV